MAPPTPPPPRVTPRQIELDSRLESRALRASRSAHRTAALSFSVLAYGFAHLGVRLGSSTSSCVSLLVFLRKSARPCAPARAGKSRKTVTRVRSRMPDAWLCLTISRLVQDRRKLVSSQIWSETLVYTRRKSAGTKNGCAPAGYLLVWSELPIFHVTRRMARTTACRYYASHAERFQGLVGCALLVC